MIRRVAPHAAKAAKRLAICLLFLAVGCKGVEHDMAKPTVEIGDAREVYEYHVPCFSDGPMHRVRVYAREGDTLKVCSQPWGVINRDLYWLNPMSGDVIGATRLRPVGDPDPYGVEALMAQMKAGRKKKEAKP